MSDIAEDFIIFSLVFGVVDHLPHKVLIIASIYSTCLHFLPQKTKLASHMCLQFIDNVFLLLFFQALLLAVFADSVLLVVLIDFGVIAHTKPNFHFVLFSCFATAQQVKIRFTIG